MNKATKANRPRSVPPRSESPVANALRAKIARKRTAAASSKDRPETWPVIWRVVAPGAGSYDHDMVFLETEIEVDARKCHDNCRREGYPVRLERIACGPLPQGSREQLASIRSGSVQNPGTKLRAIVGAWEAQS
ncbi:MAG TPA: hypothetical protein VGL55_16505 [Steroidobacteraceae bacterium]|jgi:hypothetical protein